MKISREVIGVVLWYKGSMYNFIQYGRHLSKDDTKYQFT